MIAFVATITVLMTVGSLMKIFLMSQGSQKKGMAWDLVICLGIAAWGGYLWSAAP